MSFTGKATYASGASHPEIAEDVSDLVGIVSPAETPLLDLLGDSTRAARATVHEWLEDELLPNIDALSAGVADPTNQTLLPVAHAQRFRPGDQVRVVGADEVMLVNAVDTVGNTITVTRAYGGSGRRPLVANDELRIIGNAALEGDSADAARFTVRTRRQNYTQIFSSTVEISGSELASRQLGVIDEMNYQKQLRLRELLRDLENSVINGRAAAANPGGSTSTRRTMAGLLSLITTHAMNPGDPGLPNELTLTEDLLDAAMQKIWMASGSAIDTLVVNAAQKRQINLFAAGRRAFSPSDDHYRNLVNYLDTDFGACRVVLSRYVPAGTVLFLDSSRVEVLPLAGRSFHFKPLAPTGDREAGQLVGEYTLELRNENAHGILRGLE